MNKGFTLIELLVVVLIIGILASIAIPQYQKAVEKARMTEGLTMLRAIANAHKAYYMGNGVYAIHIDELDIEIPGEDTTLGGMRRKSTKNFQFGTQAQGVADSMAVANRLSGNTLLYAFIAYTDDTICCYGNGTQGRNWCKQLCRGNINAAHSSVGGKACYEVRF